MNLGEINKVEGAYDGATVYVGLDEVKRAGLNDGGDVVLEIDDGMIQPIVDRYMAKRDALKQRFLEQEPESYLDILKIMLPVIIEGFDSRDAENIVYVDQGNYQGTLIFLIPNPDKYGDNGERPFITRVAYGSCSSCDTMCGIKMCDVPDERANDYLTLALHMVQQMRYA